jgi:hypothetical protein
MGSIGASLFLVPYPRCVGVSDEGPELEGVVRAGADGVDATGEGLTGHTRAAFKWLSH